MKFTGTELQKIGFIKVYIEEKDKNGNEIFYFEWQSGRSEYDLVSNGSDENNGDEWEVRIADMAGPRFESKKDILKWIELIKKYSGYFYN